MCVLLQLVRGATAQPAARMPLPSLASLSLAHTQHTQHAQHRKPAPRSARTGGLALSRHILAAASDDAVPATPPTSLLTLTNLIDRPDNEQNEQSSIKLTNLTDRPKNEQNEQLSINLTNLTDRPEDEQSSIILAELKHDQVAGCLLLQALLKSQFKPSLTVLQNIVAELNIPRPEAGASAPWKEWLEAVRFYCIMGGQEDPLTRVFIAARRGDVALLQKVMALHADDLASLVYSGAFAEDPIYYPGIERDALPDMDPDDAFRYFIGLKVRADFKYLAYAFRIALSYGHFEMMDFVLQTLIDRQLDIVPLPQDMREFQKWRYIDAYEYECAARSQNVKVLEWLDEQYESSSKEVDIMVASKGLAYNTNRAVAKWFDAKGVDFYEQKWNIFESAMKAGNVPLMQWLSDNHFFADGEIVQSANLFLLYTAARFGHVDVIKWFAALEGFDGTSWEMWISTINESAEHAHPEMLAFAFEKFVEAGGLTELDVHVVIGDRLQLVQRYLDEIQLDQVDYHSFLKFGERSKAEIIADAKACITWLNATLHYFEGASSDDELD